jgi:chemosensory pili system protein ChpA (sensor histidine kinase/response regulator)
MDKQMQTPMTAPGELESATTDLGPLAWVLDELRKSLDGATKALRRFVRDAELARGSDLAELDASQLRIARQQLHQAVGALEMVGLGAPAKLLRVMEALAQKFVQRPELCSDDAANKVERASFALTEYLEGVLKGKNASPVALFPQYREVLDLVGGDRVHPADLWPVEWRWLQVPLPAGVAPLPYGSAVRSRVDQAVLKVVRTGDVQGAHAMTDISLGLAAAADALEPQVFWTLSAGFFEAVSLGLCPQDVYVKRTASRIIAQYTTLAKGEPGIVERLALDLLFYCAQAVPGAQAPAPALQAVRTAYGLTQARPVDYATPQFGRFDPALLVQARKRIASATETWAALAGGDTNRLKAAADQFAGVTEVMVKLHPERADLARALTRAVDTAVRSGEPPTASVAMEVATAVLYLEAAYEDLDPTDATMAERSNRLAQRLDQVCSGAQPEPLEPWMEELYRRVSDRQTMGSVVDELRTTLGLVEKSLDQFFRNPQDRVPLHEVPSQLSQMRGVFSVLGLDQASLAALRMRDSVEKFLVDTIDGRGASGMFEKIGNSLGAMGFLIDMLSYQRALAKKLFVYDEEAGELRPVMGRDKAAQDESPAVDVPAPTATTDLPAVVEAPAATPAPVAPAEPVQPVVAPPAPVAPVAAAAPPVLDDDDAEMREIFLEEAREVVHNGTNALQALRANPADLAEGTTLRRAFHTLKGSSRMVGLTEFGEAAWAMEQLANTWLAEQKPAGPDLLALAGEAMEQFARWVEDIAQSAPTPWSAQSFRKAADALRLEERRIPLPWPGADAPAAPAPEPAPVAAAPLPEPVPEPAQEPVAEQVPETAVPVAEPVPELREPEPVVLQAEPEPVLELPAELVAPLEPAAVPQPAAPVAPVEFASTQMFELPDFDAEPAPAQPAEASAEPLLSEPLLPEPVMAPEPAAPAPPPRVDFAATQLVDLPADEESARPDFQPTQTFETLEPSAPAAPAPAPVSLDFDDIDFGDLAAVGAAADAPPAPPAPVAEVTAPSPLAPEPEPEPALEPASAPHPEAETEAEAADLSDDEQIKVIGDLRIGIPLYNVYLNEADEWSRHLLTELSEWELELDRPLRDSTIGLAHSLAGSSGTVGFMALSEIARLLEHALAHVQLHGQSRAQDARVFNQAAEDIRRLLHQFAAGFLKQPDPAIREALQAILDTEFASDDEAAAPDSGLSFDTLDTVQPGIDAVAFREPVVAPPAAAPQAPASAPAPAAQVAEEQTDVVDALDPDLFPVFEEEAADLFPQLAGALRQWAARPENLGARRETLRVLHTLKGSARLAGAMRLGEMAHRLESAIESLGSESVEGAQIEPMLARFDGLQAVFDGLRKLTRQPAAPEPVPAAVPDAAAPAPAAAAMLQPVVQTVPDRRARSRSTSTLAPSRQSAAQSVRVSAALLDRLVNQAGEVIITRSRLDGRLGQLRSSLKELGGNLDRLRQQLREIEVQSESQMQSRMAQAKDHAQDFDPLEFDRFTRVQELTRIMAESVADVATVQRNLQRTMESTEDDLIAQARQARELQRDLLRTRMVEFEGISERLYGVVRQASKDVGRPVKLDIIGGSMDLDRSVLERMAPAFEHMLRNSVAHGIEEPQVRAAAGKPPVGSITITLSQEGNDVSVEFSDDGGGLNLARIREKALANGLIAPDAVLGDGDIANLIFAPGFSTAERVTELSGRGVGLDVVRSEVNALGGRIETSTTPGQGTTFKLVVPLTTAVTQVVMLRLGELAVGVPSNLVEVVKRVSADEVAKAYETNSFSHGGAQIPFFWAGSLLESSPLSAEPAQKHLPVVVFRSAGRQVALHVDEVLGNQEVVVKNLGPQLARIPGLTGMSVLASGAVVLIYNPVALATIYGDKARQLQLAARQAPAAPANAEASTPLAPALGTVQTPLILVVDDSITVRRVTQRLLKREGYRVVLAADGLQALERLQEELPTVVLSDIEMPRMDGFDLARNIRGDERLRDLPIIMITSRIAEKHREHARELGVDHYLGKPYSEEELLGLIRHYCALPVAEGNS